VSEFKVIFALYHIYDRVIDGIVSKESKRIGFFESQNKCMELICAYKKFNGFKDYPETCFKIFEYEIGQSYWREEF